MERSGILDLPCDDGDGVMADKGFTTDDLLPLGVALNIPPFLKHYDQMPPEDVAKTQVIAALRIHVERAINKIKNFHIWDQVTPLSLQWNPDFSNPRFLEPPDMSNQTLFPLDLLHSSSIISPPISRNSR